VEAREASIILRYIDVIKFGPEANGLSALAREYHHFILMWGIGSNIYSITPTEETKKEKRAVASMRVMI